MNGATAVKGGREGGMENTEMMGREGKKVAREMCRSGKYERKRKSSKGSSCYGGEWREGKIRQQI